LQEYRYDTNETGLLRAFQSGDSGAAKTLFDHYFRSLCYYVERLTGSVESAEDIVADTFVKLWHRKSQFENLENVRHFLYRTARNAALNEQRNERRHQSAHIQLNYLSKDDLFSTDHLEEEQIKAEVLAQIYQEVEDLPDKCREIFKFLFFKGHSTDQTATELGISPQTVRNQKTRAIQLLRVQLLKKGHLLAAWYLLSRLLY
jgi:RNA polymerase sigma-70 factor (family 1)